MSFEVQFCISTDETTLVAIGVELLRTRQAEIVDSVRQVYNLLSPGWNTHHCPGVGPKFPAGAPCPDIAAKHPEWFFCAGRCMTPRTKGNVWYVASLRHVYYMSHELYLRRLKLTWRTQALHRQEGAQHPVLQQTLLVQCVDGVCHHDWCAGHH